MNSQAYLFSAGFILGSSFTCFLMYLIKKLFYPTPPISQKFLKNLQKEVQDTQKAKEKVFKDLSLTIKNLHLNPSQKADSAFLEKQTAIETKEKAKNDSQK
ncbi:MAG: hypothetical protein BGWL_c3790 [Candidatus Phytoplasma cynodontis]|nr:MAG: hypothetical protein BGWL_c3790 [Candidatus Phytoplasma cynodontis]